MCGEPITINNFVTVANILIIVSVQCYGNSFLNGIFFKWFEIWPGLLESQGALTQDLKLKEVIQFFCIEICFTAYGCVVKDESNSKLKDKQHNLKSEFSLILGLFNQAFKVPE